MLFNNLYQQTPGFSVLILILQSMVLRR